MKVFTLLCITSTLAFGWFDSETKVDKPATIKVILKKHADGALIEAKGPYDVSNPLDHKHLSSGWKGKRFYAYPHAHGTKWGENFLDIYQLCISPKSSETTFLVDGIQVKGCLELYHVDGKLHIVNEVDIENYIKSILTNQFLQRDLKPEVMDSLAIIARTNAYNTACRGRGAFWHVDAEEVGYTGYGATLQNLNVDRAVDATCHLVMSFEGRPFEADWTEHCAGTTASIRAVHRRNVSTPHGVKVPTAKRTRENTKWRFAIGKDKIAHLARTNRVTGIELFLDNESEKVYGLRVLDGKHDANVDLDTLRETFGNHAIRSNDFSVKLDGDQIIFEGYGQGLGTGLCIYSAQEMANSGKQAPHILAEFFPYTHLQQQRTLPSPTYEEQHITE